MEKKDVVRGQINTVILSSLFDGEKYGYEIRKEIENKTSGKFILKEPTLYSSLKRLEKSGFVESYWGDLEETNGGRRRYYRLTEKGRGVCERNLNEWEYSRTLMDKLISDKEIDLATAEPPAANDSEITAKIKKNYIHDIDASARECEDESEAKTERHSEGDYDREQRLSGENLDEAMRALERASRESSTAREGFDSRISEIGRTNAPELEQVEVTPAVTGSPEGFAVSEAELQAFAEKSDSASVAASEFNGPCEAEPKIGFFSKGDYAFETKLENKSGSADSSFTTRVDKTEQRQDNLRYFPTQPEREEMRARAAVSPLFQTAPPESTEQTERFESVKDYSSFQSATYAAEPDPKITEQVNRFLDETREKQHELDTREYQNKLGKLLHSTKSFTSASVKEAPEDDKVIPFSAERGEETVKGSRRNDALENEDLKALSSKIQAEGFKIKAYSSDSAKDYKSFLLKNKINFFTSLILFAAFALEMLLFFLVTTPYTKQDFSLYGIFLGVAALYPLGAFIAYRLNPDRKTKAKFSLRECAINCVLIFAIGFLVIMSTNLIFKVQFANVAEIILKVFLPSLVVFQLVVGCLVYGALYMSKKFHT